jgi:putative peptidoglycan lipid II flippase
LAQKNHDEAKKFINNVISISIVFLGVLVALGIIAAPWISRLMEGGEFDNPEYLTFALRFLMPTMIFFGFGAIFAGILQSHGVFRLPALVSAPGGVFLIIYLVFFAERFGVTGLIFATGLGVFSQPLLMIPAVYRLGFRFKFSIDLKNKNIRDAARLSVPVLISVASYHVHFLFGHSVALRFGATAVMDYAQQLVQVFILTLVYAVTAVYFPKLSALWAVKDTAGYNDNLKNSLQFTLFLVLPAALGFFVLRFEIMEFLLSNREYVDTYLAGNLMGFYALGVIAIAFKEVVDRAFYSIKDSKTPAVFGVIIMVANVSATIALIPVFGLFSVPIAYCVSAILGSLGLLVYLHIRTRFVDFKFFAETTKIFFAAGVMFFAALFGRGLTESTVSTLIITAVMGVVVYFALALVLKISTLRTIIGKH